MTTQINYSQNGFDFLIILGPVWNMQNKVSVVVPPIETVTKEWLFAFVNASNLASQYDKLPNAIFDYLAYGSISSYPKQMLQELAIYIEDFFAKFDYSFLDEYFLTQLKNVMTYCRNNLHAFENKPAQKPARVAQAGHIYVIKALTESPQYKIGRTKELPKRIETLEVKLPFEIEVIHTIKTDDIASLEKELHNTFSSKRIRGEWFELDSAELETLKDMTEVMYA